MSGRIPGRYLVALLCMGPWATYAQTTDPINATIQFNFSNPGARSLALGGAFTARADDATAAYANPAGLLQLFDPEVSIDFRSWDYSTQFLDGGVQTTLGGFEGLNFSESSNRVDGLSFVSGMYPAKSGRWVGGVFYHQLANFEVRFESAVATVLREGRDPIEVRPVFGAYELEIDSMGISGAYRLTDTLAIGATLAVSSLDLQSRTERGDNRFQEPRPFEELDLEICCQFAPRDDIIVVSLQSSDGSDNDDAHLTLGFLWESPLRREGVPLVSVGGMARQGPEFDFTGGFFNRSTRNEPLIRSYPSRTPAERCPDGRCLGRFKVPDVYSLAISFRPAQRWVLSLDYSRVRYSQLVESTLDLIGASDALELGETGAAPEFRLDDGDELRLGAEVGIFRKRRLPDVYLRAGLWNDPDHETRYVGDDPELRGIWAPGSDEIHYTAGFGLRFRRLQLDAAIDDSDRVTTFSLSSVYYFRRR